jgi:hypothetical protein
MSKIPAKYLARDELSRIAGVNQSLEGGKGRVT